MSRNRESAFSMVEMLCVVAVISILICLLLPTINNSIRAAQRFQCQNNLRQIGLAMFFYLDDWGGRFPNRASWGWTGARWHYGGMPAGVGDLMTYGPDAVDIRVARPIRPPWLGGRWRDVSWDWSDPETWPKPKRERAHTNVTPETLHNAVFTLDGVEEGTPVGDMDRDNDGFEDTRPLNQYLDNERRVFLCPAERRVKGIPHHQYYSDHSRGPMGNMGGVGTNYALNVDAWKDGGRGLSGVALENIRQPWKTVMFYENPAIGPLSGWSVPEGIAYSWHDNKRNMINAFFADGHVEYIEVKIGAVEGPNYSFDVKVVE